jgi:Tryptophanase
MGGALGFNNPQWVDMVKPSVILNEGFLNYGGISGRDMEAVASGFKLAMTEKYLEHRIGQIAYLFNQLKKVEIPMIEPHGGHAVYVNAGKILSHIPPYEFPGHALACALYLIAGVRSCEMGSIMFGRYDDLYDAKKLTTPHRYELVRLAVPRLTYNSEVFDVVVDALRRIKAKPQIIPGMMFVEKPAVLPHFSATFKPKFAFNLEEV